jgi:D-psicose/D-tagatose/L-ribulose 3-epimerase
LWSGLHVVRGAAVRAGEEAIRLAGRLGADLTIGAFRGRCEPHDVPAAIERFTEAISQLLPVARRCDVRICLEPQNRFQSSFFRTVAQSLQWLAQFDDPHVGLSLDTFHMSIEESSLAAALQSARARLYYVQLADNHRGPPGTGMFPWESFVQALEAVGYDGWMCMEVAPPADHAGAAASSLNGFRRIFGAGHR